MTTAQLGIVCNRHSQIEIEFSFSPLQLDPAIHVCDNANMKPRLAAICALGVLATCGGPTLAQSPDCAHISNEGEAECQPTGQTAYVVSDRTDGKIEVTIQAALLDYPPGTTTTTNQVLTLTPNERRKLGCVVYPPQTRTTWTLVSCHPL